MTPAVRKGIVAARIINSVLLVAFVAYVFLYPVFRVGWDLGDPNLSSAGIPKAAWRLHKTLAPRYEKWADERLQSSRAGELDVNNISGTEWPLFGSVFYLWSLDALQEAWEKDRSLAPVAPAEYAKGAIDAAAKLVIDPSQAEWVKKHWGDGYLKTENVFYRMLVISALTSHAKLTGSKEYLPALREQVDSLAAELDASPHGLLDDYPGQCYPGDVLTAIAMIQRADEVLGTDHSAFVQRSIRGFQGALLDPRKLVPYAADPRDGRTYGVSRGCGNSYVSLFAPELWPEQAREWYDLYIQYFWQERYTIVGFREYPRDLQTEDSLSDVDSGPILSGFGCAACAFGAGAARANGDFSRAYQLSTEMLATAWPLPDGTLLLPRFLSNAVDAPYLGEAAILFNLTRTPPAVETGSRSATAHSLSGKPNLPLFVPLFLGLLLAVGILFVTGVALSLRRMLRTPQIFLGVRGQLAIWGSLMLVSGIIL